MSKDYEKRLKEKEEKIGQLEEERKVLTFFIICEEVIKYSVIFILLKTTSITHFAVIKLLYGWLTTTHTSTCTQTQLHTQKLTPTHARAHICYNNELLSTPDGCF